MFGSKRKKNKMAFVGHHIEVNGLPQYDSVPDGIYVNRPSAQFLTTSFML